MPQGGDDFGSDTPHRIWTAATGEDLGLITRRIKAAASQVTVPTSRDHAAIFQNPSDLPDIVDACEVLVEHLKNMRSSPWLAATKLYVWQTKSWKKAWGIKENTMAQLIERSKAKFGESRCAMDEVLKRSTLVGSKAGHASSSHREMIDETFSYIVGAFLNLLQQGKTLISRCIPRSLATVTLLTSLQYSLVQAAMKPPKTPPSGA